MSRTRWFCVNKKNTQSRPQEKKEVRDRQTDSSLSLLDCFSRYLDCRRFRFRRQVRPIVIYIPGMWQKKNVSEKHFWPMLIPVSSFRYGLGHGSTSQGTGEGALERLQPAPGANLQTRPRTRLGGAFCCPPPDLSPSPPQTRGCSLVLAVLLPDLLNHPTAPHSLVMWVCGQVGSGWRKKSGWKNLLLLHHCFPPSTAWL